MIEKEYQTFGSTAACTLCTVDQSLKFDYYPIEEDKNKEEKISSFWDKKAKYYFVIVCLSENRQIKILVKVIQQLSASKIPK